MKEVTNNNLYDIDHKFKGRIGNVIVKVQFLLRTITDAVIRLGLPTNSEFDEWTVTSISSSTAGYT